MALGCLPATAQGSEAVKLKVSLSPNRLGAETTIRIKVEVSNTDGGLPSPATSFNMLLPPQLELLGSTLGLAVCQPTALLASGLEGCPPNALLGTGSATVGVPFGPEVADESSSIDALMGPSHNEDIGVLLFAESRSPIFAQLIFPGLLLAGAGPQGERLNTIIPPTPTLPGAPDATVLGINLNIGPEHLTYYKKVHGKTVGYRPTGISIPLSCPRGGFQFATNVGFQDGSSETVTSTAPCPAPRPHRHR